MTPDEKKHPQTVVEAVQEMTVALNECWRLIAAEYERVTRQINDIWDRRK